MMYNHSNSDSKKRYKYSAKKTTKSNLEGGSGRDSSSQSPPKTSGSGNEPHVPASKNKAVRATPIRSKEAKTKSLSTKPVIKK